MRELCAAQKEKSSGAEMKQLTEADYKLVPPWTRGVTHYACGGRMWPVRADGTCHTCGEPIIPTANSGRAAGKPHPPHRLPLGAVYEVALSDMGRDAVVGAYHAATRVRLKKGI